MKVLTIFLFSLVLSNMLGCGATSYLEAADNEGACYWRVSNGGVGKTAKALSGGVQYCQVTKVGDCDLDPNVTVTYDGDNCVVEAVAGGQND